MSYSGNSANQQNAGMPMGGSSMGTSNNNHSAPSLMSSFFIVVVIFFALTIGALYYFLEVLLPDTCKEANSTVKTVTQQVSGYGSYPTATSSFTGYPQAYAAPPFPPPQQYASYSATSYPQVQHSV